MNPWLERYRALGGGPAIDEPPPPMEAPISSAASAPREAETADCPAPAPTVNARAPQHLPVVNERSTACHPPVGLVGRFLIGDLCPGCREDGRVCHLYVSREGFWWCCKRGHRRGGDESAASADLGAVFAWEAAALLRDAKRQQRNGGAHGAHR